jgi:hypothetical protein
MKHVKRTRSSKAKDDELLSGLELVDAESRLSASEKEIPLANDTQFTSLTVGS